MQLLKNANSYATRKNAVKKLERELGKINESIESVTWFIMAQEDGRFSPVVQIGARVELLALPHVGIAIV